MKKILLSLLVLFFAINAIAQNSATPVKVHKIVFQLSSDDTLVHKSLMRQLNNVLIAAPGSIIEVVCHGPGINLLLNDKTTQLDKIQQMKAKAVLFLACENTLKEKNIAKEKIIKEAGFVKSALIEIVTRQEEGWSYIKTGF